MAERDSSGRFVRSGDGASKQVIQLSPEARKILADLESMPEWMLQEVAKAMALENELTVSHIQKEYLSFPKDGPTVEVGLRVQSNRLRSSVWAGEPVVSDGRVDSAIGSNVEYAAIHEFGGEVEHAARQGSVRLRTTASGDLLRNARGGAVFASAHHKRAMEVGYRSESYKVEYPARAPFQRGINDRLTDYSDAIGEAIVAAWENNKGN